MSDQNQFPFDDDFDSLLAHLPDMANDKVLAMARYKEHLWALVLICERRLKRPTLRATRHTRLAANLLRR